MLGQRGAITAGPGGARYRCLPCRAYVVATALGHCPRCGTPAPRIALPAAQAPGHRRGRTALLGLVLIASALAALLVR